MILVFLVTSLFSIKVVNCASTLSELLDKADAFSAQNRHNEAFEYYERALQVKSNEVYAMQGAASSLAESGRFLEAGNYFEKAAIASKMFQFFMNAGLAYQNGGYLENSLEAYQKCLNASPQFRPCHIKLAGLYDYFGKSAKTQEHLHAAIALDPSDPEGYMRLGDVYNNLKQFQLAINTYHKAIQLQGPHRIRAIASVGDAYTNLKDYISAGRYYEVVLKSDKHLIPPDAYVSVLFNKLQTGVWSNFESTLAQVLTSADRSAAMGEPSSLSPYRSLFLPVDPLQALAIARSWAVGFMHLGGRTSPSSVTDAGSDSDTSDSCGGMDREDSQLCGNTDNTKRQLSVGYISRRFEDYPGTQMMLRLFENHNRSLTRVLAFAHGADDNSRHRAHIAVTSDMFDDISALSIKDAAERIRNNAVDVLVDYDGMHDFNSIKVLLERPGKIQATWLGFAGTTGFSPGQAVDYSLMDTVIAPPDIFGLYFSEKLVYLPGGYQPQDERQADPRFFKTSSTSNYSDNHIDNDSGSTESGKEVENIEPLSFPLADIWFRSEEKINSRMKILTQFLDKSSVVSGADDKDLLAARAGSFWFICFNRMEKITPDVFEDWMAVLRRSEGSNTMLVLMSHSPEVDSNIQTNAASFGVAPDRLLFLPHMSKTDYLLAMAVADVFLDTAHYGAHTTASDAVYGGTPVLTLPKQSVSSRVAASLNDALGLSTLLSVGSRKEYVDVAISLSQDTAVLSGIREEIRGQLGRVLFNSSHFASKLDRTYAVMSAMYPSFRNIVSI